MNPKNGQVISACVFDTYTKSSRFDSFVDKPIPEGCVVVAACKDECNTNISQKGKHWFSKMGSKEIWELGYREGYVFIGVAGGNEANEKRSLRKG